MSNIDIKLNLMKFENAFVTKLQGRSGEKNCICIPLAENDIYVSTDQQTGKIKGAYLNITAWERHTPSQYGDTHNIKQSFSRDFREKAGEEAIKQRPYIGSGKERNAVKTQENTPNTHDFSGDVPY